MDKPDKFQLVVFDGDFALPSMDPECIKSILYTTITGVPVEVKLFNSFKCCAFYTPPTFIHNKRRCRTFNRTVLYLKQINFDLDRRLNPKQSSESLALCNLVQAKLKPMLEYNYWIDQRNSNELMNIWIMRSLPAPFNYIHVRRLRERAINLLENLYPTEENFDIIKEYVQRGAIDCLSTLSTRLGTADYFFGRSPRLLDIIVYSYIAPILKIPFPSNEMFNVINMWPNLVSLVKRIDTTYFPNMRKGSKYIKPEQKLKVNDDEVSYMAILILTLSAASLILGFAYTRGFLPGKSQY